MPHAYTEDQQAAHPHPASPSGRGIEQPATGGKAEGSMLKAEVTTEPKP
jgi:hypothetical protein